MSNDIDRTDGGNASASLPTGPVPGTVFGEPAPTGMPYGWGQEGGHKDSLRHRLAPILRFKWTVVLAAVLIAIPAVAAVWTLPMFQPQYAARGEVRVRPIIPRLVFKTEETGPIPHYDSFLRTQVAVIYSPDILRRVLEQKDVKATEWYRKAEKSRARSSMAWYEEFLRDLRQKIGKTGGSQLERLRKALEVRPRGRTEIIDVSMTTVKGQDAATIVNAVLDEYMTAVRESADQEEQKLYKRLSDEYETLRTEIQQREKQISALEEALGTGTPEDLVGKSRVRLDESRAQLGMVRQQVRTAELQEQAAWRMVRANPATAKQLKSRLAEELEVLATDIESAQMDVSDLREKTRQSGRPDENGKETEQRLKDAEQHLARLERDRRDYGRCLKELEAALASEDGAEQAGDEGDMPERGRPDFHRDAEWRQLHASVRQIEQELELKDFQDPEWQRLKQLHQQAELELQVARERFSEQPADPEGNPRSHPALLELEKRVEFAKKQLDARGAQVEEDLQKRLAVIKDDLEERERQLENHWATYAASPTQTAGRDASGLGRFLLSAEQNIGLLMQTDPVTAFLEAHHRARVLREQETAIQESLTKQKKEFDRLFSQAQNLQNLQQNLRYKKELYEAVQTRLEQKRVEQQVPGSITVLNRAIAPSEPSRDRRALFSAMALFGALGAGVVLAFLRDNMRQSIHAPEELAQAIQPPFLETLPCISTRRDNDLENDDRLLECIRMLRTTLLQRLDPTRGNTIQITSAGPEAGKSTLSSLLAKSLARAGRSVLLVDADLRHPALAERFAAPPGPGFLGALTGGVADINAIQDTDVPGLDFLPAGRRFRHADAELITNGTFEGCLRRWRDCYEIVLFDSSPILPVADARILAQRVDATILVAREKHCRRPEIEAAIDHLDRCGGHLLGAVLITSDRSERYGGGYYNRYGAKYYSTANDADES